MAHHGRLWDRFQGWHVGDRLWDNFQGLRVGDAEKQTVCCLQSPDLDMYGMLVRALAQIHWALPASVNLVLNIACLREVLPYYITPKGLMLSEYASQVVEGAREKKHQQ